MKTFILSASLLIIAIPASFAAPVAPVTESNSNALNPEWYPVNKSYPFRSRGSTVLNTNSTRGGPDDPSAHYIIVMKDEEKRPWNEVFDEMGFTAKEYRREFKGGASGSNQPSFRTFDLDDGGRIRAFGSHMRGFTLEMLESEAESMGGLDNVKYIEKDQLYHAGVIRDADYHSQTSGSASSFRDVTTHVKRQASPQSEVGTMYQQWGSPWNLQRISESNRVPADVGGGARGLNFTYVYDGTAGKGVDVYMIDSGLNQHEEFGDRARMIFTAYGDNYNDDHGHGTHTAGTVGSRRYGVAKNVNLLGVKVLDENNHATNTAILAGMEAALANHLRRVNEPNFQGSIVSMSIGGGGSQAQFDVLKRMTDSGMHVSISAMNDNEDACQMYPGGYSQKLPIFNVGAVDINDNKASFSNYGPCVNIHAPGVDIVSTSNQDRQGTRVMQGTSMACPAVSGVIALELIKNPQLRRDPRGMIAHIQSMSINGVVRGTRGGDILLNNGINTQR